MKKEIVALHDEMKKWRHDLHAHPETAFEEKRTSDFVADKLKEWGIEVHRGLAKTGVVGILKNGSSKNTIGLRADMDALDLDELNTFSHRSTYPGKMHACGHDGHTTMLLGAAKYLASSKNFNGTVYFIFQPAEEHKGGAMVMIKEGLFKQFPAATVYGLHNMPGVPEGHFSVRPGPIMACADFFEITITGTGTHGAYPHTGVDPVLIGSEIVMALQRIVSRSVDPMESAVVSVTQFHSGSSANIIPESATLIGTARSFSPKVQDLIESSMRKIVSGIAEVHGATSVVKYDRPYCPTINSAEETQKAATAARLVVGEKAVHSDIPPAMGAEDFGWMLKEKPGCYVWLGAGEGENNCMVHNPRYDFNDKILPVGATYWATLVESQLV